MDEFEARIAEERNGPPAYDLPRESVGATEVEAPAAEDSVELAPPHVETEVSAEEAPAEELAADSILENATNATANRSVPIVANVTDTFNHWGVETNATAHPQPQPQPPQLTDDLGFNPVEHGAIEDDAEAELPEEIAVEAEVDTAAEAETEVQAEAVAEEEASVPVDTAPEASAVAEAEAPVAEVEAEIDSAAEAELPAEAEVETQTETNANTEAEEAEEEEEVVDEAAEVEADGVAAEAEAPLADDAAASSD